MVVVVIVLYLASVKDLVTVSCFLEEQEIIGSHINKIGSSRLAIMSTLTPSQSQNVVREICGTREVNVPLR